MIIFAFDCSEGPKATYRLTFSARSFLWRSKLLVMMFILWLGFSYKIENCGYLTLKYFPGIERLSTLYEEDRHKRTGNVFARVAGW